MTASPKTPQATLPIEALRAELECKLNREPLVITSPTGSGKSTQIPRWCRPLGPVLVVEPRRVACRSLAQRVAELEGSPLGELVGYQVRDENRAQAQTQILFVTTGVALRYVAEGRLDHFRTIILDEFHERSLDVDLLLALFLERRARDLIVMSATLDGAHLAAHLGGSQLAAEGRQFPVEHRYLPGDALLPELQGIERRLITALDAARADPGDVLVFMPGKAEIASACRLLEQRTNESLEILPLHGGLSLAQQSRVFQRKQRRKVVVATNVAETSITLPGIGVVIDSGLLRRTQYHGGRGYLTLRAVARDSADQRSGRAGRTAPGVCYRLWSESARLEASTPPEVHRESLTPLLLAALSCGTSPEELPFLDPPKDYAIAAARAELTALGALHERELTERGRRLFGLPVDPALGRLLVEGEARHCLPEIVDLVAALSTPRPLFRGPLAAKDDVDDDPRADGCDVIAMIRALRAGRERWAAKVDRFAIAESRAISKRLRRVFSLSTELEGPDAPIDRRRLATTAMSADVRCVHIARHRRGRVSWSNGGTELDLARESAVDPTKITAIAVLESRAITVKRRKKQLIATCAMPLEQSWLVEQGLGHLRLASAALEKGAVVAKLERVYAKRVLATTTECPRGQVARDAILELFLSGAVSTETLERTTRNLESWALLSRLLRAGQLDDPVLLELDDIERRLLTMEGADVAAWLQERLQDLGVESGDDYALLEEADFIAPEPPSSVQAWLRRAFPLELALGDASYRFEYDLERNVVELIKVGGRRQQPPPLSYLPPFPGFRVILRDRSRIFVLKER